MAEKFTNNPSASTALTTLSANITSTSATTLTVVSNTGWPAVTTASGDVFRVLIDTEYLIVTDNSSTTWTVTRGAEGSTAATHSSGASVWNVTTSAPLQSTVRSVNSTAHRHTVSVNAAPPTAPTSGDLWTVSDVNTVTASSAVAGNDLDSVGTYVTFTIPSTSTWTNVPGSSILVPAGVPWECVIMGVISGARNATVDATAKSFQMRCVDAATSTVFYGGQVWSDDFATASITYIDTRIGIQDNDPLSADTVVKLQMWGNNANITWTLYVPTPTTAGALLKARRR